MWGCAAETGTSTAQLLGCLSAPPETHGEFQKGLYRTSRCRHNRPLAAPGTTGTEEGTAATSKPFWNSPWVSGCAFLLETALERDHIPSLSSAGSHLNQQHTVAQVPFCRNPPQKAVLFLVQGVTVLYQTHSPFNPK